MTSSIIGDFYSCGDCTTPVLMVNPGWLLVTIWGSDGGDNTGIYSCQIPIIQILNECLLYFLGGSSANWTFTSLTFFDLNHFRRRLLLCSRHNQSYFSSVVYFHLRNFFNKIVPDVVYCQVFDFFDYIITLISHWTSHKCINSDVILFCYDSLFQHFLIDRFFILHVGSLCIIPIIVIGYNVI